MIRIFVLIAVCALSLPFPLAAQESAAGEGGRSASHEAAPSLTAAPAEGGIEIDGKLTEDSWAPAKPATQFTQRDPFEGRPASEQTEVRILFDSEALYIGARMHDSRPVSARLGRRDMRMSDSDWLTIIFDSYHDHRTAFGFEINPAGVRRDQTRAGRDEDESWDPIWQGATTTDDGGWTAEIRIPFSQLRFNPASDQRWGLQLERTISRNREFSVFSFTPKSQRGGVPRFGHLDGLRGLNPGNPLEITPYTVARAEHVDPGANPFRTDREYEASFGADLKYRLNSNLTVDATVNPDFGQVEVDPAVINLSAFETRFDEKRPFFIESSELFEFDAGAGNDLFYTRRIGGRPHLRAPVAAADAPDGTTILGAAKLTGQPASGWSAGALNAVTQREEARYLDETGSERRFAVEPLTNYFVGRVRRDINLGQSALGGIFTAVNRNLDSDEQESLLRSAAYSGGIDFRHEWAERAWRLNGFVTGSHVRGSPAAILRAQSAPYHYFGRPDADHLEIDSTRTALTGLAAEIELARQAGEHWRGSIKAGTISPDFEVNDIGFQRRGERFDTEIDVEYQENQPGRFLRQWEVSPGARAEFNYAGQRILNNLSLRANGSTLGYWGGFVSLNYQLASWDDRLTRGGPLARRPASFRTYFSVDTDSRRQVAGRVGGFFSRNEAGGSGANLGVDITWKPAANWNVSLGPNISREHEVAQYLGTRSDSLATMTFGRRYLFAPLDQTSVSLDTRVNVTFTPSLSLQIFAQPLISSGSFGEPGQLAAPRTYDFLRFGSDIGTLERDGDSYLIDPDGSAGPAAEFNLPDPDFNFRSLRGNAVLRWEWRPGSTLFVAWQQARSDDASLDDFRFGRDAGALFSAQPDNVFLVKMNYWLNP